MSKATLRRSGMMMLDVRVMVSLDYDQIVNAVFHQVNGYDQPLPRSRQAIIDLVITDVANGGNRIPDECSDEECAIFDQVRRLVSMFMPDLNDGRRQPLGATDGTTEGSDRS